ncbi:MAG TPA: SMP-30/gluconolactonase/LRE family protein [Saprospiraceae bacterium]|nr:SMP-30/gluconolactonase/LRE family protein [Saprospiraceae bacterium]
MKKHQLIFLILFSFLFPFCKNHNNSNTNKNTATEIQEKQTKYKTTGSIQRIAPELDNIIPTNAKIEVLSKDHLWTEGPLWVEDGQYLLFSDIPPNSIFKWKEGEKTSLYLKPSGYTQKTKRAGEPGSNGLLLDKHGNLVLCQHGDRRMAKMNAPLNSPKSDFTTLADRYNGMKLNSPNDAVFHSNGDLYFTDPPYGLEKNADDPNKEIPYQGVYRLNTDGTVDLLTKALTRPNGIAFSPDEKKVYVSNSDPKKAIWMSYDLIDGQFKNGSVFYDATDLAGKEKGLPDGMKVAPDGTIFATGPGGVFVFSPEAKLLGKIKTGEATSNCAFGNNGKYLYLTADMYLLRVALL